MYMHLLDENLEQIMKSNKIAGMSVAVTNRNEIIYSRGFGVNSVECPHVLATADSMYRIASISKIVTGITIMILEEKGFLNLDTLIKEYVPWLTFKNPEILEQMTLRHLLSHTSGLPIEYTPDGPREESSLENSLKEELKDLEFASLPDEGVYLYSNWGIRLASYIAQITTGKMFSKLAEEYVFKALNMNKTTFDLRVAATYPLSLPHIENEQGELEVVHYIKENAARLATGGIYSNACDLCKLARFLLNDGKNDSGEQVLSPNSLKQMFTKHATKGGEGGDGYGLTMMLRRYHDRYLYGHLGSAPPYALSLFTDCKSGYGVITLMNTQRDELRYDIPEMIISMINKEMNM